VYVPFCSDGKIELADDSVSVYVPFEETEMGAVWAMPLGKVMIKFTAPPFGRPVALKADPTRPCWA
jgi:hypothetical protein